ncbi:Serine/threonine-protein kinase SBK1 [Ooceraea biroi]|uniref:Serine/threonine-protein kinase SBK1 n=2 Tax=Ooceraea biroi TaxID=2015173 RepID=A0A026WMU6_OOCBI|nr:Serine/threonine-protein kinase SBK1 [Ooceraea biroi]
MSHDVWQFGIVLFVCLTGCLPWQKAALDDPRYTRYQNWHNATLNIAKKPKLFQLISSRAQRMFKRLLDPKAEKRPASVLEVNKYLEDRWLAKLGAEKALNGGADERDELCPSMYSFHSSLEEKNQLLHTLTTYGIETTVDRSKKKDRIREWIQASAIVEENEGDESDICEDSEFFEDEENESEDAEPISMRGRHFPERRPSAAVPNDVRKNRRRASSSRAASRGRTSASAKPVERKIPFAPQVAEERETIARFASFPNGDPSLATVENRGLSTNVTPDVSSPTKSVTSTLQSPNVSVANGRNVKDPAKANVDSVQDESSLPTSPSSSAVFSMKPSPPKIPSGALEARSSPVSSRAAPMSPQIPTRKNRAHTAPFPDAPENRAESARRAQSATMLRAPEVEDPSRARVVASPRPTPLRADNSGVVASSTPRVSARSAARAERAAAAPITSDMAEASPQLLNNILPARAEGSPTSSRATTQINVSATSHLVMQSFSALQDLAANGSGAPPSPINSRPDRRAEKVTLTYGKDVYEHYGIAHGAILPMRVNIVRQDSAGSGSRSASN